MTAPANRPSRKVASLSVDERRRQEGRAWLKKNRAALDAYNKHIDKHGVFSDGLRTF